MDALLYVAIVLVWAVVLVPTWLRRHEETAEARSVDRFSRAMRVLARREPKSRPDQRYIVMPARVRVAQVSVPNAPQPVRAPRHVGRARLAARRRRVVLVLAGLVLVATVLELTGLVGLYLPLLAVVLLLAYVVHLRVQARRSSELQRRRESSEARLSSRERRLDRAGRVVEVQQVREAQRAADREAAERAHAEDNRRATEQAEAEGLAAEGWEPTPVPLPTYVTKPRAGRPTRTIDLGSGAWTAADPVAPAALDDLDGADDSDGAAPADDSTVSAPGAENPYDAEINAVIERRRAVND